jgi:cathepsin A (carboxypeptidase C)
MRALTLLPLLFIPSAFAAPASDAQIVLGETTTVVDALRGHVHTEGKDHVGNVPFEDDVATWVEEGREYVKQNGLVCMSFQRPGV